MCSFPVIEILTTMVLTPKTFLLVVFVLISAVEGFNSGVIQKRLQLFKNSANHVTKFIIPLEGEQHRVRRGCLVHDHHHGYGHHHKQHDHNHGYGHRHNHGHRLVKDRKRLFRRALYQEPYYHVSPQLFYYNKKPLNLGFSQYNRDKFFPYWFTRYNYLPYQIKPVMHTYGHYLKPMYFYLRNPQILAPVPQVTLVKPYNYNLYPIDNNHISPSSSENSLSVTDDNVKPFDIPITDNVHETIFEEASMTHAQMPVQDSNLNSENNQSDENDKFPIILEADGKTTTPSLENKIVDMKGESTGYKKDPEHTTHQPTHVFNLNEISKSSTVSLQIHGSFEVDIKDTTTSKDESTKSDDSSNFGEPDGIKTTLSRYEESITEKSYSTHEPVAITDFPKNKVTNINESSLKDVKEQTVTYFPPLETFHDQTIEVLPESGQAVELEDSFGLISDSGDENSNKGLKYETGAGTTTFELLRTKLNGHLTSTTRNSYDVTTIESPKNDEIEDDNESASLQTILQNRSEEYTTDHPHNVSTFSPEPSSDDQDYTTIEGPNNYEMKKHKGSITLQTISQNRFEPTTIIYPNYYDKDSTSIPEPSSNQNSDEDIFLIEEIIRNILEGGTTVPGITYPSELIQSKTGIEIDQPEKKTTVGSFLGDVSSEAIDSPIEESTAIIDNFKFTTLPHAHTFSMASEKNHTDYVYEELEDEKTLKTTPNPILIETIISTPVSEKLTNEESLKDHTVPVTSSSIFTDFEEQPAWKSNIVTSPTVSSMFTDFTGNMEEDSPKLKTQVWSTYSPPSIFTDSTEKSKIESNSTLTTPFLVYNDFTENKVLSTPNLKVENSDFSNANIILDESSGNGFENDAVTNNKILENIPENTGLKDKFDSVEITTISRGNWNMEKNYQDVGNKNSASKVVEDENVPILENGGKESITGVWNEEISKDFIEPTTLRSLALKPFEKGGDEFREMEKEDSTVLDRSNKQNISNINIATKNISLVPEISTDVTKTNLEDSDYYSNAVTSKSDLVDSEAFKVIEFTTIYQENNIEQSSVSMGRDDFENTEIGSKYKFSDSTAIPAYSSTVDDRKLSTYKFTSNIEDMENLATIFYDHADDIKGGAELISTTESTFAIGLDDVGKMSPHSIHDNESPTTETPLPHFDGNLFKEIKNVITAAPAQQPSEYSDITDEVDLDETTTRLVGADQYEQTKVHLITTILPNELQSGSSIDKFDNGQAHFDTTLGENDASGSLFVGNENNTDYDDLSSLETSSETNFQLRFNISSEQHNFDEESLNEYERNYINNEEQLSNLNNQDILKNFSQEFKNLNTTSPNYESIFEDNINQTTLFTDPSAEAVNKLNFYSSYEERDKIVSENDTSEAHNTSKVTDDMPISIDDYSDGVLRVYEELDLSFPSSEIALENEEHRKPDTVYEKNYAPEGVEPVTERNEQDSMKENTETVLSKQTLEPLFTDNLNGTENEEVDMLAKTTSTDGADAIETSTRAQLSEFTVMKSILSENEGEEIKSHDLSSENEYSPFHLDLLNYNFTLSKKEPSDKSPSLIEEITYYNIKNLEGDSNGDNLFVAVNNEETNGTGLLSVNEYVDVQDDNLTNNYELTRSVRYEYINPDYLLSNTTSNVAMLNSNYIKHQNDRSAKPRYIAKRHAINANASQMSNNSEEMITGKREIKSEASKALAMLDKGSISSYQGDEAYDDDDDDYENDYNDSDALSNANPLDLIEVKEEEGGEEEEETDDETKLTNDSGPSIMDLISLNSRLNKQFT